MRSLEGLWRIEQRNIDNRSVDFTPNAHYWVFGAVDEHVLYIEVTLNEDAVDWVLENRIDTLSTFVFNNPPNRWHPYSQNDFYCLYGGTLHIDESLGLLTFKPEFEGFSLENDYEAIYELKNDQLIIASGTVNSRTRPTTFSPAIGSCVDRCRKVAAKTNK